jgi:hypothetical protein
MARPTIEELQRENAELRERLAQLRNLLDSVAEPRNLLDAVGPETKLRIVNAMTPAEIGPHLRELALRCIKLARQCADPRVARELEDISIELADRSSGLAAVFSLSGECEECSRS